MKKTNLLLLALVIALGGFAYWQYEKQQSDTSLEGYDFNFAVKDTNNIGKIFLADRNGKTITLTRQNKVEWKVNGKYRVNASQMQNILDVIARIDLKYRLPRQAVKTAIEDIASQSIKVEIYDKSGEKLRAYYVGGSDMDAKGTYTMMEDANEPYVTHIPNWVGTVNGRFFTDEIDWRDRMLFPTSADDIASVTVDYPLQKSKAFKLERDGGSFKVEPLYPITPRLNAQPNVGLSDAFLVEVSKMGVEGFEANYPKKDSVRGQVPFAVLTVVGKNKVSRKVALHPFFKYNDDGSVFKTPDGIVPIERYFLEADNGDFAMVQHVVFERVFWAYESFFGKLSHKN